MGLIPESGRSPESHRVCIPGELVGRHRALYDLDNEVRQHHFSHVLLFTIKKGNTELTFQ